MNVLRAVSILLVLNAVSSLTEQALAAPPQKKAKVMQTLQERSNQMKSPPEMPGITFPNGKFLYGYRKDEGRGQVMGARFKVNDSSSNVIAYYRGALQAGGWNISPASRDKNVYATNTRLGASVTVQTFTSSPGCDVYFSYAVKR